MRPTEYISDPCRASSLPFWKTECIEIPENMLIVRGDEFDEHILAEYDDVSYFKLVHKLKDLPEPLIPDGFDLSDCPAKAFAEHIRECYGNGVSDEEVVSYKTRNVWRPDLWLAVVDRTTGKIIASGIAELDDRIGEGILEWIQVSAECRRKGLGKYIVSELLRCLKPSADFVTVSGQLNNKTEPLQLYLNCGFEDLVVWHVLTRKVQV